MSNATRTIHAHTIDAQNSACDALQAMTTEFCGQDPSSTLAVRLGAAIGHRNAYRVIGRACRMSGQRPGHYGIMVAPNGEDRSGHDPLHVRNPALGMSQMMRSFFSVPRVSRLSGRAVWA